MKYKVAVCIPTRGVCLSRFMHSLIVLLTRAHKIKLPEGVEGMDISVFMREGTSIHANRERLVQEACDWGATHLLFMDDDMAFDIQAVEILFSRQLPIVAANYPRKQLAPFTFAAITLDGKEDVVTSAETTGLQEVHHSGFGLMLIESKIFQTFPKPRFHVFWVDEADDYGSEDTAFCVAARRFGFKTYVDHDASKHVRHVGLHEYSWDQAFLSTLLESGEIK